MGSPELSSLREKFRRPKSNCQDLFHNYPPKMVIYTVDAGGRAVLKFGHKIHMRLYHAMMGERPQRMRIFSASVPVAPSGARNVRLNRIFPMEAELSQEIRVRDFSFPYSYTTQICISLYFFEKIFFASPERGGGSLRSPGRGESEGLTPQSSGLRETPDDSSPFRGAECFISPGPPGSSRL